jgi:hypothetical protein
MAGKAPDANAAPPAGEIAMFSMLAALRAALIGIKGCRDNPGYTENDQRCPLGHLLIP